MGIREWVNGNPRVTAGAIGLVVVAAIAGVVVQVMANRKKFPDGSPASFFTVDDGKTFFAAGSDNIPPFEYNGKQAVQAYVFEAGGKRFVGYLERYTPDARKAILEGKHSPQVVLHGRELKKPGERTWTKSGDLNVEAKITHVSPPPGVAGTPVPVEP
jgi:hypothetical protein